MTIQLDDECCEKIKKFRGNFEKAINDFYGRPHDILSKIRSMPCKKSKKGERLFHFQREMARALSIFNKLSEMIEKKEEK